MSDLVTIAKLLSKKSFDLFSIQSYPPSFHAAPPIKEAKVKNEQADRR